MENASQVFPYVVPCPLIWQFRHSGLQKARQQGRFIGVDGDKHPKDILTYLRYNRALRQIPGRFPMPEPLSLEQFDTFLKNSRRYSVTFADHDVPR